ncbi:MAG: hypothetical protein JNM09_11355 [Blastocatellia bacterium]|nr:hypothetical protein [Blastocatellia bacterium]
MAKSKPKKIGICAYCGQTKPLTRDHVIPECLFEKPLPSFMVTVSACEDCNGGKAKHDDYLRDMLTTDISTAGNKTAKILLEGKVLRSAQTNRSQIAKAAKRSARLEAIHTKAGIYLGHAYSIPLEEDRVNGIYTTIVRGLYFYLMKKPLPQDCQFEVRKMTSDAEEGWEQIKKIGFNGPYKLGQDVFTCIFMYADEENAISQWWMWFYESICIYVSTCPSNWDAETLTPKAIESPKENI